MTLSKIKKILYTYKAPLICLLLAVCISFGGAISFARYVSGGEFYDRPGIGTFSGSGMVYDVSALSFTNMAFWGGLEDIGVSMNSLRTVSLTVNNYEILEDQTKKLTEVALKYSLIFSAPKNFASRLAIQLSDEDGTALIPQMVITDIISAAEKTGTFTTTQPLYNGKNYIGVDENGNTTTAITFDVDIDSTTGIYTARSRGTDGTVIILEPFVMQNMKQTLYFRLWDVEEAQSTNVTEESGNLLPPLKVTFNDDIECYKITISRPEFTFPAGTPTERDYSLTLAPTDALLDSHLGGYLMEKMSDGSYIPATTLSANQDINLSTVIEIANSTNKTNDEVTLMGNIPNHNVGDVHYNDLGSSISETIYKGIYSETVNNADVIDEETITYYYRRQTSWWGNANYRWSIVDANSSNANYRIIKRRIAKSSTTTTYDVSIRSSTEASETLTTTSVSSDKLNVTQTGTKTMESKGELMDAFKSLLTETEYELVTIYQTKSENNWVSANESDFNSLSASSRPADLEPKHSHSAPTDEIALTSDEIAVLKTKEPVAAKLAVSSTSESFTRTITYKSSVDVITLTSVSNADDSIPTTPFKTHLDSGIQKYIVSTSYSKNYPFFVKILLEQIQD